MSTAFSNFTPKTTFPSILRTDGFDGLSSGDMVRIADGSGVESSMLLGSTGVNFDGKFFLNSVQITSTAAELNKLDRSVADGTVEASKALVADSNGDLSFSFKSLYQPNIDAASYEYYDNGQVTTSGTISYNNGNRQSITLIGSPYLGLSNPPTSGTFGEVYLMLHQDSNGSRTVTWGHNIEWYNSQPTLKPTPYDETYLAFITWDGGNRWIGYEISPSGGGGGVSDHGALTGLGDDDHTQYLLADGTRNLTGNLTVSSGVTIDGRDISVDGSKLDTIENSADVTDATNVNAAGAVMESDYSSPNAVLTTAHGGGISLVTASNSTICGRGAGATQDVAFLSATDTRTILSVEENSERNRYTDIIYPGRNEPPTSNYATFDTRNTHLVLDFDDTTAEYAIFPIYVNEDYSSNNITITIVWAATTATTGDVVWTAEFERCADAGQDIDSDSFATAQTTTDTTAGTSGSLTYTDIAFTSAQIDSLVAGEFGRLRIGRNTGSGSDTMSGDAELRCVIIRES